MTETIICVMIKLWFESWTMWNLKERKKNQIAYKTAAHSIKLKGSDQSEIKCERYIESRKLQASADTSELSEFEGTLDVVSQSYTMRES